MIDFYFSIIFFHSFFFHFSSPFLCAKENDTIMNYNRNHLAYGRYIRKNWFDRYLFCYLSKYIFFYLQVCVIRFQLWSSDASNFCCFVKQKLLKRNFIKFCFVVILGGGGTQINGVNSGRWNHNIWRFATRLEFWSEILAISFGFISVGILDVESSCYDNFTHQLPISSISLEAVNLCYAIGAA